jgi:hypothetical protein
MAINGMIKLALTMRETGQTRNAAAVKFIFGAPVLLEAVRLKRSTGNEKTSEGITSGASSSGSDESQAGRVTISRAANVKKACN